MTDELKALLHEQFVHRVILAISSASVPHESALPGALESRSLGYYLGVGIDHFEHDFERHETLLRKAAEQAIEALASRSTPTIDAEVVRLLEALNAIVDRGPERDVKWSGMNARDIARAALSAAAPSHPETPPLDGFAADRGRR